VLAEVAIRLVGVFWVGNSKGKGHPTTNQEGPEGEQRYRSTLLFFNLGARCGGWSKPRPGGLTFENNPVPIVQEATWGPWPVWTGAKNLPPPELIPGPSSP